MAPVSPCLSTDPLQVAWHLSGTCPGPTTAEARPLVPRDVAFFHALAGGVTLRQGRPEGPATRHYEALAGWRGLGRRERDSPLLREHLASAAAGRAAVAQKIASGENREELLREDRKALAPGPRTATQPAVER